jgi:hypothetical protein
MPVRRRVLMATVAAVVAVLLSAGAAWADPRSMVTGLGLTNDGNTLGFNAKSDLSGEYTYVAHSTTFMVRCSNYTWYKLMTDVSGFPRVNLRGTCLDQNGTTIYMETYFIDRGEPGVGGPHVGDVARVFFTYNPAYANNPNGDPNLYWSDYSLIMAGNIQILPN